MFDIGWQEIFLIAVLALIIVGPKDLPRALKTVMASVRKVKGMARDFQNGLDDIVRETELADMRREIEEGTGAEIKKEIENSIDPNGAFTHDIKSLKDDLNTLSDDATKDAKKTALETEDSLKQAAEELEAPAVTPVTELPSAPLTETEAVPSAKTTPKVKED